MILCANDYTQRYTNTYETTIFTYIQKKSVFYRQKIYNNFNSQFYQQNTISTYVIYGLTIQMIYPFYNYLHRLLYHNRGFAIFANFFIKNLQVKLDTIFIGAGVIPWNLVNRDILRAFVEDLHWRDYTIFYGCNNTKKLKLVILAKKNMIPWVFKSKSLQIEKIEKNWKKISSLTWW